MKQDMTKESIYSEIIVKTTNGKRDKYASAWTHIIRNRVIHYELSTERENFNDNSTNKIDI